jgi:hypothetical protein
MAEAFVRTIKRDYVRVSRRSSDLAGGPDRADISIVAAKFVREKSRPDLGRL